MPTQVLPWPPAPEAQHTAIGPCVQALRRGELVGLPTGAGYAVVVDALAPDAVAALCAGLPDNEPPAVALRGPLDARDWVPAMSRLGARLARRCWPGPVQLRFLTGAGDGLAARLPSVVRQALAPDDALGLYAPGHEAVCGVLEHLSGPLVIAEMAADRPAGALALVEWWGGQVTTVVEAGPPWFPRPASVVEINGSGWRMRREGVVTADEVERQTACVIVFVCTGNTCRSPLAEALCKRLLSQRLGCQPGELPRRGFVVLSAGLAALHGDRAAPEAVEVARELGADLSDHVSRPVTPDLLALADYLVAMTGTHRHVLSAQSPAAEPRLLCGEDDLADPLGCDQQVYRECAGIILRQLEGLVAEVAA
jgi:protein-tyrosine-phosphatase/tRNA A37 threonylcarbamoyladenosine synthetase subunit TsaC/SUA5/YrdC